MTTIDEARTACCDRFLDEWDDRTRVALDQEISDELAKSSSSYVYFTVRQTGGEQDTLGAKGTRKFIRTAIVSAQVNTPVEGTLTSTPAGGRKTADVLARALLSIFEGETFSGLHFNGAGSIQEGESDGRFLATVVQAPFFYEETI